MLLLLFSNSARACQYLACNFRINACLHLEQRTSAQAGIWPTIPPNLALQGSKSSCTLPSMQYQ